MACGVVQNPLRRSLQNYSYLFQRALYKFHGGKAVPALPKLRRQSAYKVVCMAGRTADQQRLAGKQACLEICQRCMAKLALSSLSKIGASGEKDKKLQTVDGIGLRMSGELRWWQSCQTAIASDHDDATTSHGMVAADQRHGRLPGSKLAEQCIFSTNRCAVCQCAGPRTSIILVKRMVAKTSIKTI